MSTKPGNLLAVCGLACILGMGCNAVPDLPATLDVATSGSSKTSATMNSGPAGLANSVWSLSRAEDPSQPEPPTPPPGPYGGILSGDGLARPPVGERMFLAHFGDNGVLTLISENKYFLAEFYGTELPVSAEYRDTTLFGVTFRSATYGLQINERFGVAVLVQVRFGDTYVGQAIIYAWGTVDNDLITGQFGYLLDFTGGFVAWLGTIADQYPVEGVRISG